jgi:hypothetical protein
MMGNAIVCGKGVKFTRQNSWKLMDPSESRSASRIVRTAMDSTFSLATFPPIIRCTNLHILDVLNIPHLQYFRELVLCDRPRPVQVVHCEGN